MLFRIFNAFIPPPGLVPGACEAAGTRGNLAPISQKPGPCAPLHQPFNESVYIYQ